MAVFTTGFSGSSVLSTPPVGWGVAATTQAWSGFGRRAWCPSFGTASRSLLLLNGFTSADFDITATLALSSKSAGASVVFGAVAGRVTNSTVGSLTQYTLLFRSGSGSGVETLELAKYVGGSFSAIATVNMPIQAGQPYCLRLRAVGSIIQGKAWLLGESEPSAWTLSGTDTSISGDGMAGLFTFAPGINYLWEDVVVASAGDASSWRISGSVADDTGVPATRAVQAVNRETGEASVVVQSAGGLYDIPVRSPVEHSVICLDDAAGTIYNDLILRTTPV